MEQGETSLETTESGEDSEATTVTVEESVVNECETPVTRDSNTTAVYAVATKTTLPQKDNEVQVR